MGSQIESNNVIFFFHSYSHTNYYSSDKVEAILAKAQATPNGIVIVS
jgi:hypothetical protein